MDQHHSFEADCDCQLMLIAIIALYHQPEASARANGKLMRIPGSTMILHGPLEDHA
jgi:hypothetical protein